MLLPKVIVWETVGGKCKRKNQQLFFLSLVNSANFNIGFFCIWVFSYLLLRPEFLELSDYQKSLPSLAFIATQESFKPWVPELEICKPNRRSTTFIYSWNSEICLGHLTASKWFISRHKVLKPVKWILSYFHSPLVVWCWKGEQEMGLWLTPSPSQLRGVTGGNCVYLEWSEILFPGGKGAGTLLRAGVKRELPLLSFTLQSIAKGWTNPHFFLIIYSTVTSLLMSLEYTAISLISVTSKHGQRSMRREFGTPEFQLCVNKYFGKPWEWKLGTMTQQANPSKICFLLFVLYLVLLADWIFQAGGLHILYAICLKIIFSRKLGEREEEERYNFSEAFSYCFCLPFKKRCWLIS